MEKLSSIGYTGSLVNGQVVIGVGLTDSPALPHITLAVVGDVAWEW